MQIIKRTKEDIALDNMKKGVEAKMQTSLGIDDEYGKRVEALIRERYSMSQEIAINRQRDTKPTEWQEYYDFCEECKRKAREAEE